MQDINYITRDIAGSTPGFNIQTKKTTSQQELFITKKS